MKLKEDKEVIQKQELPTGGFSSWLLRTRRALITGEGTNVPCGECRACCTSSYFIHIKPDETQTLASIPKQLLFPAPGLPKGNMVLGYDENGFCPMFKNNNCSIYEFRPQTCRDYDCRVFPATGLPAGENKVLISQQAQRWKFDLHTEQNNKQFFVVQAAAKFLTNHTECFPAGFVPNNTTQQAVLAIKVYDVFLNFTEERLKKERAGVNQKIVRTVVEVYEKFQKGDKV